MEHSYALKVRSYECDSYGHVNNAEYLHYLESARMEFLNDIGFDYHAMRERRYAIYIARISIAFKASAYTNDMLTVKTVPIDRKKTYGVFNQKIFRDHTEIAEADVTWVFVNEKGHPAKIPPELDHEEFTPTKD
jgi:acyl-CoA thioester hydrolase